MKKVIESFCGNVVPLCFDGEGEVKWYTDSDAVSIRRFDTGELAFDKGVLLTLKKVGNATVTAECDGVKHECLVKIREMKHWEEGRPLSFFTADLHNHSSDEHNHDRFAVREFGFPEEMITAYKDEGIIDAHVITDHTKTLNQRDFFRGFTADEKIEKEHIVFPGSESEVTVPEEDRFGVTYKNSGEIVVINANNYSYAYSWQEFFDAYKDSPFAIAILAHPQICGFSVKGIWNFSLDRNNSPRMLEMVKGVEMGDGSYRESNMLNEYVYSKALDNGFKVSTTCSSDAHQDWSFYKCSGKTIIMAEEKSKESFLDALMNRRFYGCSSANLKLVVTVNGKMAPCTLEPADKYNFNVNIDYFRQDASTVPVKCSVVSDRGKWIKVLEGEDLSHFEFTLEDSTASYFYLRLMDNEGRKTWSPPIWTGREPIVYTVPSQPLPKDGWTAIDTLTGEDASVIVCNDVTKVWQSKNDTASIIIDMKEEKTVSAVSHYPPFIDRFALRNTDTPLSVVMGSMAAEYVISIGTDGQHFEELDRGFVRIYGGEEILPFEPCTARYIKVDILSNVAKASDRKDLPNLPLTVAELSVY